MGEEEEASSSDGSLTKKKSAEGRERKTRQFLRASREDETLSKAHDDNDVDDRVEQD